MIVVDTAYEVGEIARFHGAPSHFCQSQAALARENNPSASLSELAAMMEPAITKPAMNNRMKKLVQTAKEIRQ
ncbi:MAG: hypothetical protein IIU50_05270 [Bacteroidaceae bacterium]|nr:hypothetical protein [Bacteroidaceae bacterium]